MKNLLLIAGLMVILVWIGGCASEPKKTEEPASVETMKSAAPDSLIPATIDSIIDTADARGTVRPPSE